MAITIYSKEEFFNTFEIEKMNAKSLTIVEKRTYEHFFISRNAFNTIMANRAERIQPVDLCLPNGRPVKWIQVLTWQTF